MASSSVEERGEGSVVYFECVNTKTETTTVTGICKLKTLEYRFYRKLREKLKRFLNKNITQDKLLKKFKDECYHLTNQGNHTLVQDFDLYLRFAEKACEVAEACQMQGFQLSSLYLDFLDLVRKCDEEDRLPTAEEKEHFSKLEDRAGPGGMTK